MLFFTSDTHFGHYNIIKFCSRPFLSVEHMDEAIISNINRLVQPNDTLYHLGDFSFRAPLGMSYYRDRINCKNIHLILGNHDVIKIQDKRLFSTISDLKQIKANKKKIIMCHYAMRVWNSSHHGSIHLYGHSHNTLPRTEKSFDVGVDCWNYCPISLDEVIKNTEN